MTPTTRERIRAAAIDLFYARGYTGTTMRDLADACGLTPGALYNHFVSKDDLLFEIVAAVHDGSDAALAAADDGERAAERLEALTAAFTAFHVSHPRETRIAERDYIHLSDDRREEIVGRRRAIRDLFAAVLRDDRHADRDVTAASMAILNMAVAVGEWYDPAGATSVEETARLHGRLARRLADPR